MIISPFFSLMKFHVSFQTYPRVLQIYNATVKMGTDGTDDDVTVGICSDSKTDCCEKKLSRTLSDDWKKNKVENWKKSAFGDCSKDGKTYRLPLERDIDFPYK